MKGYRYYFFLYLHVVLLAAWYTSPFYLDWRLVILTVALYHVQVYYAKGCLLTSGQFGKNNEGFYYYYLRKFGWNPNKEKLHFILDYIIPGTMIMIAVVLQVVIPLLP
jgi:hypothetical protein